MSFVMEKIKAFGWIGINLKGKYRLDICSICRIFSNIATTVVLPLMDVITDINVAWQVQWIENVLMELNRHHLLDPEKEKDQKKDLKQLSNNLTSTIIIMLLLIPFLSSLSLHVIKSWKEWKVMKNPWAPLTVILELPVLTGIAQMKRNILENLRLRYLEFELESKTDLDEIQNIKSVLQKKSLRIIDWQIRCTVVEFYFESAPMTCFLLCCYIKWGGLSQSVLLAFVTSTLTSCMTVSKIYLSYKQRTRPLMSHKFFALIPCGILSVAKLFSFALLIVLLGNIAKVKFQYIFMGIYAFHCLVMVNFKHFC